MRNNTFSDKIREELLSVKEQGYKTSVQKRVFIITLLGLGSFDFISNYKGCNDLRFYQILYLAPFVTVLFDLLEAEHKYSVRRIGKFLLLHSEDELEQKWEKFVDDNRDNLFRHGETGFTVLTFLISICYSKQTNKLAVTKSCGLLFCSFFISFLIFWDKQNLKT